MNELTVTGNQFTFVGGIFVRPRATKVPEVTSSGFVVTLHELLEHFKHVQLLHELTNYPFTQRHVCKWADVAAELGRPIVIAMGGDPVDPLYIVTPDRRVSYSQHSTQEGGRALRPIVYGEMSDHILRLPPLPTTAELRGRGQEAFEAAQRLTELRQAHSLDLRV